MSSSPRFQILPEGRADVRFARWLSLESRDTATLAETNLTAADARALVIAGKIKMLDPFIDTTPPAQRSVEEVVREHAGDLLALLTLADDQRPADMVAGCRASATEFAPAVRVAIAARGVAWADLPVLLDHAKRRPYPTAFDCHVKPRALAVEALRLLADGDVPPPPEAVELLAACTGREFDEPALSAVRACLRAATNATTSVVAHHLRRAIAGDDSSVLWLAALLTDGVADAAMDTEPEPESNVPADVIESAMNAIFAKEPTR